MIDSTEGADMADRHLPTEHELAKVRNLASWRARLGFVALLFPVIVVTFVALNSLIPGGIGWPLLVPVIALLVAELGLVAYVSFFLRCPRCSTWIGAGVSKCASCGLKFGVPKDSRSPQP
jgi:hypothetical protein